MTFADDVEHVFGDISKLDGCAPFVDSVRQKLANEKLTSSFLITGTFDVKKKLDMKLVRSTLGGYDWLAAEIVVLNELVSRLRAAAEPTVVSSAARKRKAPASSGGRKKASSPTKAQAAARDTVATSGASESRNNRAHEDDDDDDVDDDVDDKNDGNDNAGDGDGSDAALLLSLVRLFSQHCVMFVDIGCCCSDTRDAIS